jgi:hypothetical protein
LGGYGGAISGGVDALISNCTFFNNDADSAGGAVYCWTDNPNGTIANCVLWSNSPDQINVTGAAPQVRYSDIQGGWQGEGNINADPQFEEGTVRLGPGSPCIDAADNTAVPPDEYDLDEDGDTDEPMPFDLDGNPRFVDDPETWDTGYGTPPIVDMGAYEFQGEGEECPADFDGDGDVDTADLLFLLGAWGTPAGDVDGDGDTDTADLLALLGAWGECP